MNKIIEDALVEVNRIRVVANLQPITQMPKGLVQEADYCPIARALKELDACVGDEVLYLTIDDEVIYKKMHEFFYNETPPDYHRNLELELELSGVMKTFIHEFDIGHFPELMDEYTPDSREE